MIKKVRLISSDRLCQKSCRVMAHKTTKGSSKGKMNAQKGALGLLQLPARIPVKPLNIYYKCTYGAAPSPFCVFLTDTWRTQPDINQIFGSFFYGRFSCFATYALRFDRLYEPYISIAICLESKCDIALTFRGRKPHSALHIYF